MDLDSKIKAAFKRDSRKNKWDPDTQPNLFELSNFLYKSGYRLIDAQENKESVEVLLEPLNPGHLYPEISHDMKDNKFYIKIVEHGMLEASDVESIIIGYENAVAVVRYLESIDTTVLEIEK